MSTLAPLTLDPGIEPWERQPGETVARHNQFCVYRDAGRLRTLRKAAETLAKNPRHIRAVAAAYKWRQRAEAWDLHRDRLDEQAWAEERRKAREVDGKILNAAVAKLAQRLPSLPAADLSPADLIRLLDVTMRHRRTLFGDPTTTVQVTGAVGQDAQLAEYLQLSPEQRRAALADLAEVVRRRLDAAVGADDGE